MNGLTGTAGKLGTFGGISSCPERDVLTLSLDVAAEGRAGGPMAVDRDRPRVA